MNYKRNMVTNLNPKVLDGIPVVSCEDVLREIGKVKIIDVRRADEFNNELGHIPGSQHVTLGPDLTRFLEDGNRSETIVFVCRSGMRSAQATEESLKMGYRFVVNMTGGMLAWNEMDYPKENV